MDDDARVARLAELIAGSPHNLVSHRERSQVASVHIPESMALLPHLPLEAGQTWLDLGTGGGLPGLVLALCAPDVAWVLLDSTRKKIAAVEAFAAELGLANVTCHAARAEELARDIAFRGRLDGVVARAVAPMPTLVELARGFVRPDGVLAAVKGPTWQAELAAARAAMKALRWSDPAAVHISAAARPTWLVTMRADGAPPTAYPRRVGVPRREPIGGA